VLSKELHRLAVMAVMAVMAVPKQGGACLALDSPQIRHDA